MDWVALKELFLQLTGCVMLKLKSWILASRQFSLSLLRRFWGSAFLATAPVFDVVVLSLRSSVALCGDVATASPDDLVLMCELVSA
jgi:hypothetical protein